MYLLFLLVTPVISFSLEKMRLYDTIDCNMISKLSNITIISNDYTLLTGTEHYIFMDKTPYTVSYNVNLNHSYCYDKRELTLHFDCDKYTRFTIHSTIHMIDNFIDNLKNIDKYNFTNTILYVNNNTTKCSHPSNKQEFYPLFLLFILWYIIFKCF